ncbi:hypothetical protein R0J90_19490, partial [Micrococcus sp. SIMBA_144]
IRQKPQVDTPVFIHRQASQYFLAGERFTSAAKRHLPKQMPFLRVLACIGFDAAGAQFAMTAMCERLKASVWS